MNEQSGKDTWHIAGNGGGGKTTAGLRELTRAGSRVGKSLSPEDAVRWGAAFGLALDVMPGGRWLPSGGVLGVVATMEPAQAERLCAERMRRDVVAAVVVPPPCCAQVQITDAPGTRFR